MLDQRSGIRECHPISRADIKHPALLDPLQRRQDRRLLGPLAIIFHGSRPLSGNPAALRRSKMA